MTTSVPGSHSFLVSALSYAPFAPLFALSDAELAQRGIRRVVADEHPGFPCRVSLEDAQPGETLLLMHHLHHDVAGPYRASGPIYVREHATRAEPAPGEVPELLRRRLLSLRAYGADGMLLRAEVVEDRELAPLVTGLFADPDVAYLHAHNAKPGCYNCRIDRVQG
jgi:hypothetical protein